MSITFSTLHNNINSDLKNSSNYFSDEYLKMNRCGWSECTTTKHYTNRPKGRLDYNIMYVKSGSLNIDNTVLEHGNMCIYRPEEPQLYSLETEDTKIFWIHFSGELANKLFKDTTYNHFKAVHADEFEKFCTNTVKKYYMSNFDELTEMEVTGELLSLLSKIALSMKAPHNSMDKRIEKVISYIHNNPTDKLSNDEYAQMSGLSKAHFIQKFTAETGLSPQKYRTHILLDKSLALLEETDLKIYEISDLLGIDDNLYFCRMFKKLFNVSPSQYRKNMQKNAM